MMTTAHNTPQIDWPGYEWPFEHTSGIEIYVESGKGQTIVIGIPRGWDRSWGSRNSEFLLDSARAMMFVGPVNDYMVKLMQENIRYVVERYETDDTVRELENIADNFSITPPLSGTVFVFHRELDASQIDLVVNAIKNTYGIGFRPQDFESKAPGYEQVLAQLGREADKHNERIDRLRGIVAALKQAQRR
jgi:hypothetical protein